MKPQVENSGTGFVTIAAGGNRLSTLIALRAELSLKIADATPKELPGLSKEFRECLKEIEAIPQEREGSITDAISERRKERLPNSEV
jgi:hypothetical protein